MLADNDPARPVPFSRLTLTAQLEVLGQPPDFSWRRCAPLNPFLSAWRDRAAVAALGVTRWPRDADVWLAGTAYAERFANLLAAKPVQATGPSAGGSAQAEFIRQKLRAENLYPLTWSL